MQGWYRAAAAIAPKPSYHSLDRQTAERVALYQKVEPPGDPLPVNVTPFDVRDDEPSDVELQEAASDRIGNGAKKLWQPQTA